MKIVIRLDDISPGMDMGKFRRFKRLLDEYHIKPLIGVVPENQDPKLDSYRDEEESDSGPSKGRETIPDDKIKEKDYPFWHLVRNLQTEGWIIAMHGLHHVYTTKKGGLLPLNKQSEFAGIDLEKQIQMVAEGKKILGGHGIATDFFMAPSHSYDKNTMTALAENGFRRITDGFGKKAYRRFDMTFYPISFKKDAVLKDDSEGYTTFVVHTNTLNGDDFAYYEKVFESGKVVSWDDWLLEEPVEASDFQGIKEYLMARFKYIAVHKRW
ncbi:DUF2334 domain-containing protein [Butyrivibrio sp. VCD2006]|uniref:DUF2334 domain-containing protein n=1 Tax=Butyrivibrio sp. VCD2006 TaxID=1280664 RepID=UPI0003F66905|nr:DUF2334 domain-containing protein [Butyrivibrio sp. VCD2006]